MARRVMAAMVSEELATAAQQAYAERARAEGLPVGPSALVRYALAMLAGLDAAAAAPMRIGRPRKQSDQVAT